MGEAFLNLKMKTTSLGEVCDLIPGWIFPLMRGLLYKLFLILYPALLTECMVFSQQSEVITPHELKNWVSYLSSDAMKGRANGSPELKIAADWISGKFSEYGLKPLLKDGNFVQEYSYQTRQGTVKERNIIGMIEGTDPELRNEYIVLSAHFDHVGIKKGKLQDSIYNGADDNASGTCTLIGIARAFKESGFKPGRTLVFAAFSGEESGMKGSAFFVANSPVPMRNVYANMNFEMTGHSEYLGKRNYYMTGCNISNLDDIIRKHIAGTGYNLIDTIKIAQNLFFSSDNISFSRIVSSAEGIKGIPSGTFATSGMAPHLHSPTDEAGLFDFDNMAVLVNHFADIVKWLSKSRSAISFTDPEFSRIK
jgi:hypothetical protein